MLDIGQQRNPHARSLVDRMLFFSVPMTDDFYFYALKNVFAPLPVLVLWQFCKPQAR